MRQTGVGDLGFDVAVFSIVNDYEIKQSGRNTRNLGLKSHRKETQLCHQNIVRRAKKQLVP